MGAILLSCTSTPQEGKKPEKKPDFHFIGSVYMMGKRAGWEEIKAYRKADGWRFQEEMYIKVIMLGLVKEMRTQLRAEIDRNGGVEDLTFLMTTQDATVEAQGKVKNDTFYVSYKPIRGTPQSFKYPLHGPLLTPQTFVFAATVGLLKEGDYSYFDPSVASFMPAKVEAEREGVWKLDAQGIIVRAHTEDGKLVLQNQPLKMDIVAEPPERAKAPFQPFNVLSLYAIRPKGEPIRDLKRLTRLDIKLYPVKGNLRLEIANQRILWYRADTYAITVLYPKGFHSYWERVKKHFKGMPWRVPDSLRVYLQPTQFLEVDDPEVRRLAQEITSGKETPFDKAKAIMDWVYTNLEKRGSVTIPTAKQVLRDRYGDCNEHATLYAALARAAGIPTDIVVGLVYQGDGFYYHAWNISWLGNGWIPVDPVYGEFPARPYRIALQRGSIEKQATIMAVIGLLNIEVLKVEHER